MIKVREVFNELNQLDCFGYLPTSSSIKPAHIANGWFRRVLGRRYDPVLLNQTVVHWTQNGEVHPSDKLLADNASVFEPFQPTSKRPEFDAFRQDLKFLVSPAGGAVNRGNRQSSYNLTCDRHVTEDYNDRDAGAFLYHLLQLDTGDGPSPAIELIRNTLSDPKDEVSTITAPLTLNAKLVDVVEGTYRADSVFKQRQKVIQSVCVRNLRTGFDKLSSFESAYGGGLDALRRFVAFGVFSVMLHMTNRFNETQGKRDLSPLFVYFPQRQRNTAYQASHSTYNLTRRLIETLYAEQLRASLESRIGVRPTAKKIESFVGDLDFGNEKENPALRAQLLKSYQSFSSQMSTLDALAEAFRETIFRTLSGTPLDFYRQLGVKVGFLRPAGNSAVRKHYTLQGVLLEALLASVLPSGDMTYREFLDELSNRYGLLIGGRAEDGEVLMAHGIGNATVQDLRANSQLFRQELLSIGWAKQFADGVLAVHVPEGLR